MKRLLIVCALFVVAAAATGCEGEGAGPARSPVTPFGSEPAGGSGTEAPPPTGPTGGGSLGSLCAQACAKFEAVCAVAQDPSCAAECAAASPPGCEAEFLAFVQCLATAPLTCIEGSIDASACTAQVIAVSNCGSI